MTVAYNGKTLVTDTLYENGTIEVKDGCKIPISPVDSSKVKQKF